MLQMGKALPCTILGDGSQDRAETPLPGWRCWHLSSLGAPGFSRSLRLHRTGFLKLFEAYGRSAVMIQLGFSFSGLARASPIIVLTVVSMGLVT